MNKDKNNAKEISDLIDALVELQRSMDVWLNTYAHDMCSKEESIKAFEEISEEGGTIAYITKKRIKAEKALKKAGYNEH